MTYARFAAVLWQQEVETVEMEMVAFGAEDCRTPFLPLNELLRNC